jgi:magnesium transporter
MIIGYRAQGGRLMPQQGHLDDPAGIVWIDMVNPSTDEESMVEALMGLNIPTRDDMQEIEPSSRLYAERGAIYLTAQIIATHDAMDTEIAPVTFMLTQDRLITVHYHTPGSIAFFAGWAQSHDMGCTSGQTTLMALIETMVDRLADVIEGEARKLDALTKAIFEAHRPSGKTSTLAAILQRIGRAEDLNGKVIESLSTLQRMLTYMAAPQTTQAAGLLKGIGKGQLKSLSRDVRSLSETAGTQSQKILFQLDATLGVINIRQSDIIKIFSVVAFVFLPPTLIASIYGMNFKWMPELDWHLGYPMAIGLMVLSAVVPYLIFRAKKLL